MSALALRTEENVRAALTSQVAGNETMTGFAAQLWDGLNDALSFPIALLAAIIEQLFPGLDLTTDSMSELLASVSEVPVLGDLVEMLIGVEDGNLDDLGTWFLNMRDFFGDLNFLDPEFDAGQAVEDFVDMLLLLPGKLVDTLGLEEAIENSRQWLKDTFTGIVDATDTDLDNWLLDLVTSGSLDTALENGVDGVSQWVRDTLTGLVDATDTDLDNWVLDLGNSITGFFTKLGGGSNMVVDPTFTSTSQWRCSSNTGELSTDSAHSGTLAWKATLAGGTNVVVSLGSDSRSLAFDAPGLMWKVRPAESYVVELWVRGDTGNSGGSADVDLTALVVDSKGVHSQLSPVLATVEMSEAMHASEWTKLSATYRIPAGYDRFTVYLRVVGASAGDVLFVDDAVVREETGSQDIVTKFLNAWGGSDLETAAGAVPQAAVAGLGGIIANINSWFTTGANLVGDPTGSKASYWDGGQLDGQHAISTGFKHSGLTSLKMTALSGSAISWPVFRDGDGAGTTVPVRPGQKYEVSMWIRGHSANVSVGAEAYIQANISDSSGVESTQFHVVEDDFKPDPDNFYKYGGIVTIPAGYDRMDVRPYWSVDAITGDDMFIDDISVKDITESQNIKDKLTDTTDATDSDLDDWILSLADGSAVDAWQQWLADTLTGFVDSTPGDLDNWLLSLVTDGKVPLSSITDEEPNLVRDPTFRSVSTLNGEPGWTLDDSFVHSESGNAAKISCNGTTRELGLGTFPVVSDQPVKASIFAQWSGGVANLVGSPMVEYGSQWTLANGALIASDQSFSGSKSIKLPGGGPVSTASIDAIPVTPGVQYHVRFRARKDAAYNGSVGNSKLRWGNANSSDALIDAWSFASTDIPAPDAWYNFEAVKTVPEGVTSLNVRLSCDATAGNVWIDDVVITPTTAPVRVIAESYKNGNLVNEEVIAAAPADETCYDTLDWVELSGEIVASGADRVRILLQIDEKASYGNVWWSDVSVTKTVTATAPPTWIDGLTSTFDAIGEFIQWIGTIILEALTGLPLVGWLFDDLYESFNDLFNTSNDAFANAEDALGDAADAQDTADAAVSAAGVAQSTATGAASAASAAQGTADAALADAADAMAAAEAAASALAAKIAAGQSICTNPGFEDDGLFMGAWTRTTSHRHSGTVSVTATGSGSGQTAWLTTDATAKVSISAQADDVFYCEFFVRGDTDNVQTSGAPAGVRVFASCNDATTVGFATPTIASHEASTAINGEWSKASGYVTLPAGTVSFTPGLYLASEVVSGDTYWVDDVKVIDVTEAYNAKAVADAALAAAGVADAKAVAADGKAVVADGKAEAAQSAADEAQGAAEDINVFLFAQTTPGTSIDQDRITGLPADVARLNAMGASGSNLIADPSCEDTSLDSIRAGFAFSSGGSGAYSHDDAQYVTGTRSIKYVYGGGTSYPSLKLTTDLSSNPIPVRPGQVFYMAQRVYVDPSNTGTGNVQLFLACLDNDGGPTTYPNANLPYITATGEWVLQEAYLTVSANCFEMYPYFASVRPGNDSGDTFWFDSFQLYEVTDASKINQALFGQAGPGVELITDAVPVLPQSKVTDLTTDLPAAQSTASTALTNAATAQAEAEAKVDIDLFTASMNKGSNLVVDPQFTTTAIPRSAYGGGGAYSTDVKRGGTYSYKWTADGTTTRGMYFNIDAYGGVSLSTSGGDGVEAGDVFYHEVWIYSHASNNHSGAGSLGFVTRWVDSTGVLANAYSSHGVSIDEITPGTWTKLSYHATCPDGYNQAVVFCTSSAAVASGNIYYADTPIWREVTQGYVALSAADEAESAALAAQLDADTAQGTANTAVTNAATADAKAVTAQGVADIAKVLAKSQLSGGANLIGNPGFENAEFYHGEGVQSSEQARSGTYSRKKVQTGAYGIIRMNTDDSGYVTIPCRPSDVFYLEAWVYAPASNTGSYRTWFQFYWLDESGGQAGAGTSPVIWPDNTPDTWVKMSAVIHAPSSNVVGMDRLWLVTDVNAPAGNVYYFDDVIVQNITEAYNAQLAADAAQADADTAQGTANTAVSNAATADAKAVGAQNDADAANAALLTKLESAVFKASIQSGANLIPNPSFRDTSLNAKHLARAEYSGWSFDSSFKRSGSQSLKFVGPAGTAYPAINMTPDLADAFDKNTDEGFIPVVAGQVFYLSCWVYADPSNTGNNRVRHYIWGRGSVSQALSVASADIVGGEWVQVAGYVTIPSGRNLMVPHMASARMTDGVDDGDTFWFDDFECYEVTEAYNAAVDAATAQGTANTAVTNAATADAKAVTADGKAVTAQSAADAADAKAVEAQDTIDASAASSNLVISPNFEDDWVTRFAYGSAPLAYTTAQSFQGHQCIQFTSHVANWTGLYLSPTLNARRFTVNPGDVMAAKLQVKPHGSNNMSVGYVRVWMRWYNSHDGTYTDNYSGTHTINNTAMLSSWQQLSITGTCPSQKDLLDVFVLSDPTTPVGNIYYVDAVSVQEVTEASNAQSTADDAVSDAATAQGTANTANTNAGIADGKAEDAQATADAAFPHDSFDAYLAGANNLVVNPTFEDTSFYVGPASYSTAYKHWGTRSLKMTGTGADQYARLVSNKTSTLRIQAHPGQYFYIEYWVYAPTSNVGSGYGRACSVGLWCYDSSNVYQQAFIVDGAVGDIGEGSWVKRSGTVGPITDPDVTNAVIYLYLDQDVPSGDDFYFDDIIVKEVTEAVEAQDAADTADSKAEDAQDAADTADGKAEDAQDAADTADSKAENAQDDVDSVIDNVANSFLGGDELSGASVSDARDAMDKVYSDLSKNTRAIQDLQAKQAGAKAKGTVVSIDFSDYADGNLPSIFDVSYTGAGTSTLGVVNGVAQWRNTNNADRRGKVVYNGDGTATDFQIIRGTMAMAPQEAIGGGKPYFYAIGRVSDDGDDYVWARAYCNGWFIYKCDIGYAVNNVETTWSSNNNLTWSLDMSFVLGVGSDPRTYQVWSGNTMVKEYTESGTASKLGAGYRQWGCIAEIKSGSGGPRISGKISGSSVADNAPPDVNGSTARMYRVGTGTVSFPSGGPTAIPNSFFSHIGHESPDVDANTTYGTFTVAESKPYIINARIRRTASMFSIGTLVLQVKPSGGSWGNSQYGPDHYMGHGSSAISGSWIQYLNEGDQVRLATYNTGGALTCLSGESDGEETYFAIAGAG